ncbi:LADA_0B01376g1_1 [Lachancea dasiensis]|uniref:LADA_0B01376g1_1 n=1 Tax=Lachancea dasiensis TaxID=1072105 RepID=A0A1G4IRR3_9SACH|nr:LADA_0B01376g1_1 [Lachancea dasiensis]
MQANTLIARANNASVLTFGNSTHKFWTFDWCTPQKLRQTSVIGTEKSDENDASGEELYNFKYKVWQPSEKAGWHDLDADADEIIDLTLFDRTRSNEATPGAKGPVSDGHPSSEGLSAEDIRGAVGGQETLPGLAAANQGQSSGQSDQQDVTSESNAPQRSVPEQDAEILVDSSMGQPETSEAKDPIVPTDAEGDINLS